VRILVLAGKNIEEAPLLNLLGDNDFVLARYAAVSRGVRRLESEAADLVILVPDEEDTSWERAVSRMRKEYATWSILLGSGDEQTEKRALDAGAFDVLDRTCTTPSSLTRCTHLFKRQQELETSLLKDDSMNEWLEKTARLGIWEMTADGKTTWSKGTRRIFQDEGRLTEDFASVRQFVHPEDHEIYDQANKATFDQGWPLDFEYRILNEAGEIRHLHLHRRVDLDAGGKIQRAYGMVRDVTPEREFENFLFRRDAILQVVGSFANRFLRESDWEQGMNNALEALGKAADVTRVYVFHKGEGRARDANLSMVYEWAAPDIAPRISTPEVQDKPFSIYARWRSVLIGRKVIAGNVSDFQTEERKFFEASDIKAIMLVPVFVGNQWWGFLGLSDHRKERDWVPTEIESMTMVADMLGSAVLRGSMEDQLIEVTRSAEEAKTIALEASKAKSRFLANMSHEIRTPISGILGMTEMTITTGLNAEQREHMDMIRDAARSLLSVINDVLDISKIEADKMELKPEDYEFRTVVKTAVRPFGPQADSKNVVFLSNIADDIPVYVHGDPDRLVQILINLVGNAMKFTERGLIELNVEVSEKDDDRTCLLFTVRDTGEGIPKEKLSTIFESFTQADSSTRKKHQGTGLGLTISKELVEMMGGQIGVDSHPGRGSTFSFTAWFDAPKKAIKEKKAETALPQTMHLNILMAEDNPLNQKFLTHFLSMFGHTVTVAGNGIEALEALRKQGHEIDLVLMDIQMPEMGGLEATQAIRESDGKSFDKDIPIIALTAYAMKGDKERMLDAGMNDYVSKPVDMKALSAAIARAMEGRKTAFPTPAPKVPQAVRDEDATGYVIVDLDMDSLIERFDGDMELLKDILDLFVIESDEKLAKLDAEIKSGDLIQLGAALHSITNISSHVLAMDVVNLSRELEKKCYKGTLADVTSGVTKLRPMFVALIKVVRNRAKTL